MRGPAPERGSSRNPIARIPYCTSRFSPSPLYKVYTACTPTQDELQPKPTGIFNCSALPLWGTETPEERKVGNLLPARDWLQPLYTSMIQIPKLKTTHAKQVIGAPLCSYAPDYHPSCQPLASLRRSRGWREGDNQSGAYTVLYPVSAGRVSSSIDYQIQFKYHGTCGRKKEHPSAGSVVVSPHRLHSIKWTEITLHYALEKYGREAAR